MPFEIIRKLSLRHRNKDVDRKQSASSMRKISSCKGLAGAKSGDLREEASAIRLPDDIIAKIIDRCDFGEQLRLRTVSRFVRDHVNKRIEQVTHLDVKKDDLNAASRSDWIICNPHQVAFRIDGELAEIVVDSRWTSRDIQAVVALMSVFRRTVIEATIDAPIAELLVVSLSALDLNRWYAFQCYMKAMDVFDADMHLECDFNKPFDVYWPQLQYLTIRTTEKQAPHLARVIDYGVQCNWVLERRNLQRLRIVFTDLDASSKTKALTRHLYHFRCWAGSAGFDHRFEQKFALNRELLI